MKEMKKVKLIAGDDYSVDLLWALTIQYLVDRTVDKFNDDFKAITGTSLEERGAGDKTYYEVDYYFNNEVLYLDFEFLVYVTDEEIKKLEDKGFYLLEEVKS